MVARTSDLFARYGKLALPLLLLLGAALLSTPANAAFPRTDSFPCDENPNFFRTCFDFDSHQELAFASIGSSQSLTLDVGAGNPLDSVDYSLNFSFGSFSQVSVSGDGTLDLGGGNFIQAFDMNQFLADTGLTAPASSFFDVFYGLYDTDDDGFVFGGTPDADDTPVLRLTWYFNDFAGQPGIDDVFDTFSDYVVQLLFFGDHFEINGLKTSQYSRFQLGQTQWEGSREACFQFSMPDAQCLDRQAISEPATFALFLLAGLSLLAYRPARRLVAGA
ncbi:MAG: hypothetical protein HYV16_02640 [Gammaproteobacteria bacterium]|nr:hypothetical protein [Gammaproteobacteria bacterium]